MAKAKDPPKQDTPPVVTEADLKKIINRMSKRRADIAAADAQVKCADVALRNLKGKLKKLEDEQDADEALVKSWIRSNPDKLDTKSTLDVGKAVLSLPAKPAAIKNLDGMSDKDVIAACEKAGRSEYVRITKKFERSIVKSDWNAQRISEKELKKLGLYADTEPEPRVKLKEI